MKAALVTHKNRRDLLRNLRYAAGTLQMPGGMWLARRVSAAAGPDLQNPDDHFTGLKTRRSSFDPGKEMLEMHDDSASHQHW